MWPKGLDRHGNEGKQSSLEEESERGQTKVPMMANLSTIAGLRAKTQTYGGYLCAATGAFVCVGR